MEKKSEGWQPLTLATVSAYALGAAGRHAPRAPMGETTSYLRDHPSENTEFLVGKAKAGSQAAWERIYAQYRKMLIAQVQSRTPGFARRRFDAEDILQIAFENAWKSIRDFEYEGEGSFRRWLSTLVVNAFQNELRRKRLDEEAAGNGGERDLEALPGSETAVDLGLERTAMLEAMGLLGDEDRDILIQRHIEELSFEDIGRILGCARKRAQSLYAQAVKRLQIKLGP